MEQKARRKLKRKPAQLLPRINSRPSFIDLKLKEFLSFRYSQSSNQAVNLSPTAQETDSSPAVLRRLTNNRPLKQTLVQRERFGYISGGTPVQKTKVEPHRKKTPTNFTVPKQVFVLDGKQGVRSLTGILARRLLDPKANWLSHKQCSTRSNNLPVQRV